MIFCEQGKAAEDEGAIESRSVLRVGVEQVVVEREQDDVRGELADALGQEQLVPRIGGQDPQVAGAAAGDGCQQVGE